MNTDALTGEEHKEILPQPERLSFLAYDILCNQNNESARKNGILSEEIFEAASNDESTVFAELEGVRVPILVDIKYGLGLGYDESRAAGYAGTEVPISVMAVPVGDLDDNAQRHIFDAIADSGERSIFYADNEGRDSTAMMTGLENEAVTTVEVPLPNYRCRPENRQASLSLFICDATLEGHELIPSGRRHLADVQKHFDEQTLPSIADPNNATILKNGADFTDEQLDDLWDLYVDKFEFLGENHPISMEDTREDFLQLINDESMTVSIRYEDAKPICFTYFTEQADSLYWLNQPYIEKLSNENPALTPLFFPGIVSSRAAGNHAQDVISLFAHESADVGMSTRVIFENTNLSEMYVPRIIQQAVEAEPLLTVQKAKKVDQTVYRLLHVGSAA